MPANKRESKQPTYLVCIGRRAHRLQHPRSVAGEAPRASDMLAPMRQSTTPVTLFEEIENNVTGKLTYTKLDSDYLQTDENLGRMASYLIETYKPQFTTVHLVCVDHFAHADGRDSERVRKAVAGVDNAMGGSPKALTAQVF